MGAYSEIYHGVVLDARHQFEPHGPHQSLLAMMIMIYLLQRLCTSLMIKFSSCANSSCMFAIPFWPGSRKHIASEHLGT